MGNFGEGYARELISSDFGDGEGRLEGSSLKNRLVMDAMP
jgi:hypothetical protein